MQILSVTLFILVIFSINKRGDAIIDKFKEGINKAGQMAKKFSSEVVAQGVEFYCEHSGQWGEYAAKGFGFLQCDKAHQAQDYCKFVDDSKMVYEMICCLGEEQRKEAFDIGIGCFQTKDKNEGQDCLQRWWKWISSLKEVAELLAKKAGGQ